jgi:cbb3-type cytochrome oxidase cytochrome c subunit
MRLFVTSGCLYCHTYLGTGTKQAGAPDLTSEGSRHKGIRFQIAHLRCPACVVPGSTMPSFKRLGEDKLRKLALFLEASKGSR